jgi:integrase
MVKLRQDSNGNYIARKRLPDDVRDEYGRRHKARYEAKFFARAGVGPNAAKQKFREWDAEVTARIDAIRAELRGEGVTLTRQQARALAGEWYQWFVARHPTSDLEKWDAIRDQVHEALREAIGDAEWERSDPDELWRQNPKLRKELYPILADVGETAQFLAMKRLALNVEGLESFLYWLYDDLAAVLARLRRLAEGDYSDDAYAKRFPKFEGPDSGETSQQLFERWVSERKPAYGTIESWGYVFEALRKKFVGRSAGSIMPDEATDWIRSLITSKRSAQTVKKTYLNACKTVFGWALEHKLVSRNPFVDVKVTVAKRKRLRETQAFRPAEWRAVLTASLKFTDANSPDEAARRWVPWLCAYTGARVGEIAQLRKDDVAKREGIPSILITPEAGAVKGGRARVVPLHEHLVAQGFLKFVSGHAEGPLFYSMARRLKRPDKSENKKPPYAQVRQRLADWVRSVGVDDPHVQPNHAWRHTFKQIADRAGITERASDYITGHAHKSVGATYGAPTLEDMAEAMKKFPRYVVE